MTEGSQEGKGFHRRTLLLGAVLSAAVAYVTTYSDMVVKGMQLGVLQFAPGAVGSFLLVYGVVKVLRAFGRLRWMTPADLLVIYLMLFAAVFVSTRGFTEKLMPAPVYLNYYADPINQFAQRFIPYVNPALVAFDPKGELKQPVAVEFYESLRSGSIPWGKWIRPLAMWFLLYLLLAWSLFCIGVILRRQWADHERLTFPHTVLPTRLLDESLARQFLRSPLTWMGFALAFLPFLINGIHLAVPTFPQIPLLFWNVQNLFTSPPWNQMFGTSIFVSFAAMGFAYFLPNDLLFSLWFFFALIRLADVGAAAYGIELQNMPSYPTRHYIGYQVAGAYVVIAFVFVRSGWGYYNRLVQSAFGKEQLPLAGEVFSARLAVWGLLAGFVGILAWCVWAGVSIWLAIALWAIFLFVTCTVMARSVAEAGFLMTETSFKPSDIVGIFSAKSLWGNTSWTHIAFLDAIFFRDLRGMLLSLFLDSQQLAPRHGLRRAALPILFAVAIVVAFISAAASELWLHYTRGGVNLYGYPNANVSWAFTDATNALTGADKLTPPSPLWFSVGIAVTGLLYYLRNTFMGFPLHPLGYALCPSWTMYVIWFPVLVTWVVKSLIQRYGGYNLYLRALPFFLGMILGEFSCAALWALLASTTGLLAPEFPWP